MDAVNGIVTTVEDTRLMSLVRVTTPVSLSTLNVPASSIRVKRRSELEPSSASTALRVIIAVPSGDPSITSAMNGGSA